MGTMLETNSIIRSIGYEVDELPRYDMTVSDDSSLGVTIAHVHHGDYLNRQQVIELIEKYVRRTSEV